MLRDWETQFQMERELSAKNAEVLKNQKERLRLKAEAERLKKDGRSNSSASGNRSLQGR